MDTNLKIKNIHKKMEDPIIAEWVLERLSDKKDWAPDIEELEQQIFDDETIQRLIHIGDHTVLTRLFLYVSPERLKSAVPLIVEQWPQWKGTLAGWSMLALGQIAPEKAESLLTACVDSVSARDDVNRMLGVFQAILKSRDGRWKKLAAKAIDTMQSKNKPHTRDLFLPTMIAVASVHGLPVLADLLAELLAIPYETNILEEMAQSIYRITFNRLPFFELVTDLDSDKTHQSFKSLSKLFCDAAPLDDIDSLIRFPGGEKIAKAAELLRAVPERGWMPLQSALVSAYENNKRKIRQEENQHIVAQFMLALTAACHVREAFDWSQLSLNELFDVASWDIASFPGNGYDELIANIRKFPKDDVIPHIKDYLLKTSDTYGECHLAQIMGDLGWQEFVPTLVNLLGKGKGDFVCKAAERALCKMGPAAETAIVARWKELDDCQKIYGIGVLGKVGGEKTVQLLVDTYPEMRNADLDPWCDTAMCVPDIRLLEVIEPDVRRKHPLIDETFSVLCVLLDRDYPSLLSTRARADENREYKRKKTEMLSLEGMSENMFEETIRLELQCPLCGDLNIYDVKEVYVDPQRNGEKPFIADEITCSSCGKQSEFELTETSFASLSAEMMRIMAAMVKNKDVDSPIKFVSSRLVDGRSLSLRETTDYYRHEMEENPNSIADLIGLGNTYSNVNRRKQAEECYRKCFDIDKSCPEAAVSLAKIHVERDDLSNAFNIMNESLKHKDGWQYYRLDNIKPKGYVKHFVELYNHIRQQLGLKNPPLLQQSFFSKQTRRDVGRNDPCPCGSGKKYKKCCLSKGG